MKIANPIYDVVFKYLMEDTEIAKSILSAILNVEIVSLDIKPQELITTTIRGLRLMRIDFKATVRDKDGSLRVILIEIQKSKKNYTVSRFRRYIAKNYFNLEDIETEVGKSEKVSLPITTIYFLGFRLKKVRVPVLFVKRTYYNAVSGKKLKVIEDFVEHLSHDLYAIQIPRLAMVAQTELEKILDIFSQHKYKTTNSQVLEYTGPQVERMLKRLNMALQDDQILEAMYAEDEVENEFQSQNVKIDKLSQKVEEERRAKEEALKREQTLLQELALLKEKINPLSDKK